MKAAAKDDFYKKNRKEKLNETVFSYNIYYSITFIPYTADIVCLTRTTMNAKFSI